MTSKDLTFATTEDTRDLQYRADVVIDLRQGTILKNRFGLSNQGSGPTISLSDALTFVQAVQKVLPVDIEADRRLARAMKRRPVDGVPRKLTKK